MKAVTITQNDAGQRLDKFLSKYLKSLPNALLYKYIRLKRVKVNGGRTKPEYHLVAGDLVELYINDEFFEDKSAHVPDLTKKTSLDIIYEDENILLVNKAPGLLVHPDKEEQVDTLIARIQAHLFQKGEYVPGDDHAFTPALCNRIDRNTGGIVIAAKNSTALREINEKIRQNQIVKLYLCIAVGSLESKEGTLSGYLIKNRNLNRVFVKDVPEPGARRIITKYRVLREKEGLSLLEVELVTGRTHQIRAHFASTGHPLLGDGKYGINLVNKQHNLRFQALCAYRLRFLPQEGGLLCYLNGKEFKAPLPDFAKSF